MINNCSRAEFVTRKKTVREFQKLEKLIHALNAAEIPEKYENVINHRIQDINSFSGDESALLKLARRTHKGILDLVRKELKIVPRHYYQNLWMAVGMIIFGVPFGLVWSMVLDNPAFFSIGIGMGLPIGLAVGAGLDKKAAQENRQIDV